MTTVNSPEDIMLGGGNPVPVAASSNVASTPGARLAEARQKLGLSVGDIAAKLRMSVAQIDAMERGEYSKLPTGTFLRGFVRSYAKLVGLDPESVLRLLEDTHADSRRPPIVVPTQNIKMSAPGEHYNNPKTRGLLLLALLAAILGGAAYWWFEVRPNQGERLSRTPMKVAQPGSVSLGASTATTPAPDPASQPVDAQTPGAAVSASPASPAGSTPPQSAQPESPPVLVPQPAPLTQTTAPLAPPPAARTPAEAASPKSVAVPKGSGSLSFSFSGESWVEVVDAGGKTVMSRRFQAGQSETIVGKLPVSVVIGNATVTKLRFNDVEFDLTPHTRVSVARFTLK